MKRAQGRPTDADIAARQRAAAAACLERAAKDSKLVAAVAKQLGEGAPLVRKDLAAVQADLERSAEIPADLGTVLGAARTPDQIEDAMRLARSAFVGGAIDEKRHKAVLDSLKAQAVVRSRDQGETVDPIAEALDVLTPQEVEAVERYRASVRTPALKPGESPPPPPPEDEEAAP